MTIVKRNKSLDPNRVFIFFSSNDKKADRIALWLKEERTGLHCL